MIYLSRLTRPLALALAGLALTAASASARIVQVTATGITPGTGTAYDGSISGTENGIPTLVSGGNTISCTSADFNGTTDGTASTASLSFSWGGCFVAPLGGGATTSCTMDPISNVSISAAATGSGNGVLTLASGFSTTITCGGTHSCTWSSTTTAGGTPAPVTADFNASANTATLSDTLGATGSPFLCGGNATWNAVYTVQPTNIEIR